LGRLSARLFSYGGFRRLLDPFDNGRPFTRSQPSAAVDELNI
jgi:hypothetical protein